MEAAIVATGSELISGLVQDSNSKFLAENLNSYGIEVKNIYICGDDKENLKETIYKAAEAADLIFITGGLGPTKDDQTKEAFAEAFSLKLNYSEEIAENLKDFFCAHHSEMTENNLSQAYLPEGAEIVKNIKGTAPALKIEIKNKILYLLPGVPSELKYIFKNEIASDLKKITEQNILIKEFNFIGLGESTLADKMDKIELPPEISLSYQAGRAEVKLRLKLNDNLVKDKNKAAQIMTSAASKIKKELGDYIYGEDAQNILDLLYTSLVENKLTISTAESFTGGLLAERLSKKAGSSSFFKGSAVVYTAEMKEKLLDIEPEILKKYGAVSRECVLAMAQNCAELFKTEIAVATTGAAGPKAHAGKEAGTMQIGIFYQGDLRSFKLKKNYGRELNRFYASQIAFFELLKLIENPRRKKNA